MVLHPLAKQFSDGKTIATSINNRTRAFLLSGDNWATKTELGSLKAIVQVLLLLERSLRMEKSLREYPQLIPVLLNCMQPFGQATTGQQKRLSER